MSSHRQIFYHLVFGTKNRKPTIPESSCEELYKYISGVVKNSNCKLYRINGVKDHIHIFSDLHPSVALSDFIKSIKVSSSLWMKDSGKFPAFEGWQDGYGAFTYSVREKDKVIEYINNQKEHHKSENFYDEYKRLLIDSGVEYDERFLF